jgi:hypothetical protein
MPAYTITLAHDVPYYGTKDVEAATWEEAVASLTWEDFYNGVTNAGEPGEERVVSVEQLIRGETVELASDISFSCDQWGIYHMLHELCRITKAGYDADTMRKELEGIIDTLNTAASDPIFKKESN